MTPAERAAFLARPEICHAIKTNVDAAPPLSEATKARLAALFVPACWPVAAQRPVPGRNGRPTDSAGAA